MVRLFGPGLISFLLLALWLYCIFDVISTDEVLVRNLPKLVWLLIVIFLPDIGSIAWLALGRPRFASWRPGGEEDHRPTRRVIAVEDRPDFGVTPGRERALEAWEADLVARERRLRDQEKGDEGQDRGLPPTG
ncbi:MAG: PLDc N-terminal domain-containing protein [Acidimicrobiales bacterium]